MMDIKETCADEDGFAKLVITIPASDLPKCVDDACAMLAYSGHVPVVEGQTDREAVEKVIGAENLSKLLPRVIMDQAASRAMGKKEILPMARPTNVMKTADGGTQGAADGQETPLDMDADLVFESTYVANPVVELTSYEPVAVKVPVATISDAEVDRQLEYIAQSAAKRDKDGTPVIPAITDLWVKTNVKGCENVAQFKERLKEDMLAQKKVRVEQEKNSRCVSALATRIDGKLPKAADAMAADEARQSIETDIKQHGMTHEQFCKQQGLDETTFNMMVNMQASMELRQGLALDALARHLGYVVEEADFKKVFDYIASQEKLDAASVEKDFKESGRMLQASQLALRMKASDWLHETATFTDEEPRKAPSASAAAPADPAGKTE